MKYIVIYYVIVIKILYSYNDYSGPFRFNVFQGETLKNMVPYMMM